MKKLYWAAGFGILAVCFFIYILYFTNIESKIEKTAVSKIQQWTHSQNIQVEWQSISIQKLQFKIKFNQIQFKPPRSTPIKFSHVTLKPALLSSLIRGQWMFHITLDGLHYYFKSHKAKNRTQAVVLSQLSHIPIYKILITNSSLHIHAPYADISLKKMKLDITNKLHSLEVQWEAQSHVLERSFNTQSQMTIHSDKIHVHQFQITGKESDLLLSGQIPSIRKNLEQAQLNIEGSFSAQDFQSWIQPWKNIDKWSNISGFFKVNSQLSYSTKKAYNGPFKIEVQDLLWKHISIDKTTIEGVFNKNDIELSIAHLEKENQWTAYLDKARFQINPSANFSFENHIYVKNFHSIENILNMSTGINFKGPIRSSCKGSLLPLSFHCPSVQGTLNNFQLIVERNKITRLPHLKFKGSLSWANRKYLKGLLSTGSHTQVQFQTLLHKDKKTTFYGNIDFSDVDHIYGLTVDGKLHVEKGVIIPFKNFLLNAQLKTQNFVLDGFRLGFVNSLISVSKKFIHFKKVKGTLNKSQYQGSLQILLHQKPWIKVQSQFQPLHLEDLSTSLAQNLPLPFTISGLGSAQILIDSPLNWPKLSYHLTSQFEDIHIMDEFFQKVIFNIKSVKGLSKIEKALFHKIKGRIQAQGAVKSFKKLNINISGDQLLLERMEFLKPWIHSSLSGLFAFQMHLKGSFQNPKFILKSQLDNIYDQNRSLGKSLFRLKFSSDKITGQGSFFNKKLLLNEIFWNHKKLSVHLTANQLDFIPLLPFYEPDVFLTSQLTGSIFLEWPSYQLQKTSGYLNIQHFSINHGNNTLQSSHPLNIHLNHGDFTFPNSAIKLTNNNQPLFIKKVNPAESLLTGPIQLEFLTLLTPSITSAKGTLNAHFSFKNNLKQFSPNGSFQIQNGSFKLSSFLDTFQDVQLTGVITPRRLNFENFTAQTSTGSIEGSGSMDYSNRKKRPIDMSFKFNQMGFFFSKNTKTQGSGQIYIYGDQRPYTIKGNFYLDEGYSKGKFEIGENTVITEITQKKTPWFHLNLLVDLNNPFLIENELIFASVQGTLHILGSDQVPLVSGTLNMLPGGVFYLRDYDFKIESGQISYNQNPFINPALDITGITNFEETQYIEDRETLRNYKITAYIYGRMGSMSLKLSSDPPLSENNILSMMALGARSIGFTGGGQLSNAVQYSYTQIASALFQDIMGRKLENIFGLQLSIIPYANKDRSSTKIRARKRWSENFSASASTSIDEIDRSLRFEYNLTPNFSLLGTWKENKSKDKEEEYNFEIEYKVDF